VIVRLALRLIAIGFAALCAMVCTPLWPSRALQAQEHPATVPELRLDGTSARIPRLELSAGAVVPVGIYVRLALSAGAGVIRESGAAHTAGRADAIARFELDPLKQHSRGGYVGGGLSLLGREGPHVRAYLALVAGLELKQRLGWIPSIEAGLGGGARVSVGVRRAMELWR
jgi:hypothetical protein